jgi:hypothetical protein
MPLHAVPRLSEHPEPEKRTERPILSSCPICGGNMEVVYQRNNQQVVVCVDCQSGITVPATAWEVVRIKRQASWMPKP